MNELSARVPAAAAEDRMRRFSFHGSGGTYFGIWITNFLLAVVTLGIHAPWGRAKVRHYLYGQVEFEGDRFSYHGTGKELFFGWLKVLGVLLVANGVSWLLPFVWKSDFAAIVGGLVVAAVLWILVPVAIVGSQRYRLSRTSWRGIRFSFRGLVSPFLKQFARGVGFLAITLGLYTPFFQNNVRRYLLSHSYFGSTPFHYDGEGRDLFPKFIKGVLLSLVTFGLAFYWYKADRDRYFWQHTHVAGATFESTVKGIDLLMIDLAKGALSALTLGIAYPWIRVWELDYKLGKLAIVGPLDVEGIVQDAQEASATGDELSEVLGNTLFDIELGL
jgi:uncharacterized membrane protein YjgN (DUF898 family)